MRLKYTEVPMHAPRRYYPGCANFTPFPGRFGTRYHARGRHSRREIIRRFFRRANLYHIHMDFSIAADGEKLDVGIICVGVEQ